jgi:hypothetical protein
MDRFSLSASNILKTIWLHLVRFLALLKREHSAPFWGGSSGRKRTKAPVSSHPSPPCRSHPRVAPADKAHNEMWTAGLGPSQVSDAEALTCSSCLHCWLASQIQFRMENKAVICETFKLPQSRIWENCKTLIYINMHFCTFTVTFYLISCTKLSYEIWCVIKQ